MFVGCFFVFFIQNFIWVLGSSFAVDVGRTELGNRFEQEEYKQQTTTLTTLSAPPTNPTYRTITRVNHQQHRQPPRPTTTTVNNSNNRVTNALNVSRPMTWPKNPPFDNRTLPRKKERRKCYESRDLL